jgi:predicted ATPase
VLSLFAGPDLGVSCGSYLAHIRWHLGRAAEARHAIERTLESARAGRPFSMAIALDYATMLDVFQRDSKAALARSRDAIALCSKHQFAYYLAVAEILGGWALAMEGDPEAGVTQVRHGLDGLRAMGAQLRLPFYYGLLAEAQMSAGKVGEAMANIAGALAYQSRNQELWAAPQLERIQRQLAG